ncbi:hypothetical protein HMPREF3181_00908 [Parvimonas sp. KA00067]|uniref:hypothetical protein n=1 Tax=Parvimonas sp. KA00067 TaxID=1588755 RepID=UPI000798B0E1|nr:hypothetical protein [Parvimonas sp. KA00067]KXB66163.1 hypothetical protein HMPREF3181_00908 [Parvimonas sp. KA00067]
MIKRKVEEYLGKNVLVKVGKDEYIGVLEKGTGYETGYYHCKGDKREHHWFRSSHINFITYISFKDMLSESLNDMLSEA